VDLYVRKDALPTEAEWDYRPYLIGNDETVTINSPEPGTYYIMLKAYVPYAGVTLQATYWIAIDPATPLANGVPVSGLTAKTGDQDLYRIDVPAGQDLLTVSISGGTGDCDLYVKRGSKPTTGSYDYAPFLKGNDETVEVINPAADTWYILLHASEAYAGVTLVAAYSAAGGGEGNFFDADPNCVALWRFEDIELGTDSIGTNTLVNEGAQFNPAESQEGSASAAFSANQLDGMSLYDDFLSDDFPTREGDTDVEMSICFWMKPSTFSFESTIISKYLIATDDRSWRIFTSNRLLTTGILKIGLGTGTGSTFYTYEFDEPEQELNVNHWYHVAFTYRDADRSYHVRVWDATAGALLFDVVDTAAYQIAVGDAPLALGTLPLKGRHFDGLLDEVVVFRDVLTSDEIDQIRLGSYGQGKP